LEFTGHYAIDDVQVIATHEPLQILAQPESRSVYEGGAISFSVSADGGPPISYAWRFNGMAVDGATNATLLLDHVKRSDAGNYSVTLSNAAGSLVSTSATLTVDPLPTAPVIALQPAGDMVPAGYAFNLTVVALGNDPLTYQWFRDGASLPGCTNRVLAFTAIDATNAGTYSVRVVNALGDVSSLPTAVAITNVAGGGCVNFQNVNSQNRAPIYDYDGVTKLSGTNYVAQLYAGASQTLLRPVGSPRPFSSAFLAGFFSGGILPIPDVPVGQPVYVQIRVWQSTAGVSFEDARARGGKWGSGPIFLIPSTSPPAVIPVDVPMVTFKLRAGSPLFTAGVLSVNRHDHNQPIEWKLVGASNSHYLIEKRTPPQSWSPLFVITNTAGSVLFMDTNSSTTQVNFYRARMLD
jgi:hypothetical protein